MGHSRKAGEHDFEGMEELTVLRSERGSEGVQQQPVAQDSRASHA